MGGVDRLVEWTRSDPNNERAFWAQIYPKLLPLQVSGDPNSFVYLDLANQANGIGTYLNPLTGNSDFGPYPSNMDVRNGFRSPGLWNVDAIFSKLISLIL